MKKIKKSELKKYLINILNSQNMLVLSTCRKNIPRATPMDYYLDGLVFYIHPGPGKKIENLKKNHLVSLAVFAPFVKGKVQGLQISSSKIKFLKKGEKGFERAQKIYRWKNKEILLKIIPEKIELLDYSLAKKGYSPKQVLIL